MTMNNYKELKEKGYFIGVIDGAKVRTSESFIIEIGNAFKFPSYYGKNMDALAECINDLDWLEEKNYALIIENSSQFLIDETETNKKYILNFLEKVHKEWANVPNFEGEEEFRKKADFKIIFN
jgi:RNAse (barnase) inhibitor barstar